MFKFAHSLSVAVGFVVACAQTLCGVDSAFAPVGDSGGDFGIVAKIRAQVFKNISQKEQTRETKISREDGSELDVFLPPNFDSFCAQPFDTRFACGKNADFSFAKISPQKVSVQNVRSFYKSHPIRAPSDLFS